MLAALAAVVINHVSGFSVHEMTCVLTVFLRVWFVDDAVLDAIAGEALGRGVELHAEDLSNLLWSVVAGARRFSDAAVLQVSGKVERFVDLAEEILLKETGLRDFESLSSAVGIFRKLSRLETALSLRDQLLGVCSASRRERLSGAKMWRSLSVSSKALLGASVQHGGCWSATDTLWTTSKQLPKLKGRGPYTGKLPGAFRCLHGGEHEVVGID